MLKLFERQNHDTLEERVSEELPVLPPGIEVPDDLSTLELPASMRPSRAASAVRWLRWTLVLALLVAGAVVAAVMLTDGDTTTPATEPTMTAMNLVQEQIDLAIAERAAVSVPAPVVPGLTVEPNAAEIIQAEIDHALWLRHAPAQEIVQYEIDVAIAERQAADEYHTSPAAEIIQAEIDVAIAERQAADEYHTSPAAEIIQAEIDQALWLRHASAQEIVQYEIDRALAEAN